MNQRRTAVGTVVSHRMQKTVVVEVERRAIDPKLGKVLRGRKRFAVHDQEGVCRTGDQVLMVESRPISRTKHWRVEAVLRKGTAAEVGEAV